MTAKPRPVREKKAVKVYAGVNGDGSVVLDAIDGCKDRCRALWDKESYSVKPYALLPWSEYLALKREIDDIAEWLSKTPKAASLFFKWKKPKKGRK